MRAEGDVWAACLRSASQAADTGTHAPSRPSSSTTSWSVSSIDQATASQESGHLGLSRTVLAHRPRRASRGSNTRRRNGRLLKMRRHSEGTCIAAAIASAVAADARSALLPLMLLLADADVGDRDVAFVKLLILARRPSQPAQGRGADSSCQLRRLRTEAVNSAQQAQRARATARPQAAHGQALRGMCGAATTAKTNERKRPAAVP